MDTSLNLREVAKITLTELATCHFSSDEIFTRDEDKRVRFLSLDKAFTMAFDEKVTCLLVIHTTNGFKAIQTKVLGLNINGIKIEDNIFVPLHAVYSVNIE